MKMIQVVIGSSTDRETKMIQSNQTLRQVLDDNNINYAAPSTTIHLDGSPLRPGDMDKSFDDLGIQEKTYLLAVTKTTGA